MPEPDEVNEILRKMGELRKDPQKWEEYIAPRAEKALNNWRKH